MYLYFSGLSLRRTAQRLSYCIKRNHVTIWNWIQKYHPIKISSKSNKISEYIVDEILLKVGSEYVWLWVGCYWARKQEYSNTIYIKERNKHTHCREIYSDLAKVHGKHPVSTDGGTWYPQARRFLNLNIIFIHHMRKALFKGQYSSISRTG